MHAESVPPPDALDEMLRFLEDPSVAGGNFGLLFDGPRGPHDN